MFQGMREGKPGWESYILPETHPAVEACRASLEEKRGKNRHSKSTRWPAERHKHMLVRQDLAAQHALFLPDPEELPPFPDGSSSEWLDLLPLRMRDAAYLHWVAAYLLVGEDPKSARLSWDLMHTVRYAKKKHPSWGGLLPCFLRTHYIFMWHSPCGGPSDF